MHTAGVVAERTKADRSHIAVFILILVLLTGAAVTGAIVLRPSIEAERSMLPAAPDTSTLALDRDGTDLFAPPSRRAPNTTGLVLDRSGADTATVPVVSASNVTDLNLDRDGADIVTTRVSKEPDITGLNLDRDGADIP
jgi:hypothetical protein